ncbi:MAG: transporter [Burkholderiales bacterium]
MGLLTRISLFSISALAASNAVANCGSAVCSINTNTEIQYELTEPGFGVNLRYEFVDLDQPREGRNKVGAQGEPGEHDELETINHNLVLGLDYVFNQHWGIGVQIPYLKRKHVHIHNPDEDEIAEGEEPEREELNFSGIGDVRAVGRYQFDFGGTVVGVHAGLKLPTGKRDGRNDAAEEAERSLQLGTGSTDVIAGVFAIGSIADTQLRWFAQTQWQHAISIKDDFRPGDEFTLDLGLRYLIGESFAANVQLNTRYKRRDSGDKAEPDESGGKYVYVSPGLTYAFARGFQIYGYVQVPLYQNVNGIQLTQSTSYVAGVSYRF